ncbi:unnamed protein product [Linum trigynum]|uniref:Uncharacterized protein n=1 Tax=Linum trigynum TaxID=586398 RepID=A0AAV2D867_9ROSI
MIKGLGKIITDTLGMVLVEAFAARDQSQNERGLVAMGHIAEQVALSGGNESTPTVEAKVVATNGEGGGAWLGVWRLDEVCDDSSG